jgi:surface antigen
MEPEMIRTAVVGALAASLLAGVAPEARAQGLGPLASVFNCNRSGNQQTTGALIGGALGGLAGVGVARNDTLGGILGAVVGAAAGSYIGCNLGRQDQVSLDDATIRALNEGRSTTWSNAQTGASARINVMADTSGYGATPAAPRYGDRLSQTPQLAPRVSAAALETVAPRHVALSQTYIRLAPTASAQTNGLLTRDQTFDVLAKVQGQPWLLVGRNGQGVGYVPQASARATAETAPMGVALGQPINAQSLRLRNDVTWAPAYETADGLYTVRSNATVRAAPSTSGRSLGLVYRDDEVEALARVRGGPWILIGRDGEGVGYVHDSLLQAQAPAPPAVSGYVQASNDCRIVEQALTTPNYGSQTERMRACRTADGSWSFARL